MSLSITEMQNADTTPSGMLLNAVEGMDSRIRGMESSISWDDPEPLTAEPKEHIDLTCLPKVFSDMCRAVSESLTVSTDMVAAAGLGVLSVCCNKHQICLKDGWFQPMTLYMVGCAAAGEKKSAVLDALKKPLNEWTRRQNIVLRPKISESRQRYKNLKSKLKKAERDAENGKPGAEEETILLARQIDEFQEVRPVRLYSGDATSEQLSQLIQENNERFAILSDEGGILQILSGDRYGNGTGNYDIYCQGYNGETVTIDRVNRGAVSMERPVLSMVLFVQPVVLSGLLGNETLQGVGLIDRCLFYAPKSTIGQEQFEVPPVSPKIETAYTDMVFRLLNETQGRTLRLTADARKLYADWYNHFTRDLPLIYDDLRGWGSKFRGTIGRIAGILQMVENGGDMVTAETMYNAIVLSDYFAEQARTILRSGGLNQAEQTAMYILGRIKAMKEKAYIDDAGRIVLPYRILRQGIHRKGLKQKSDYNEPLQVLVDKGYIDLDGNDFDKSTKIYCNPKIWR